MRISWTKYIEPLADLSDPHDPTSEWISPTGNVGYEELKSSVSDGLGTTEIYRGPVVSTASGLMGVTIRGLVARSCSLWLAVCDSDVTERMLNKLAKIPGVEILRPMTRYRFMLGVCPLFDVEETKEQCEIAVSDTGSTRLSILTRAAGGVFERFAIIGGPPTYPGGPPTYEVVGANSQEELVAKIAAFGELWEELVRL